MNDISYSIPAARKKIDHTTHRRIKGSLLTGIMYSCAAFTVLLLAGLLGYIFIRGLPEINWQLLSTKPSVLNDTIGILPNLLNTLYVILLTLLIALPLGVGAAIYLTEYAKNKKFAAIIEFEPRLFPESLLSFMVLLACWFSFVYLGLEPVCSLAASPL